jgi:NAD(P)-dependent dehydrogenase (short-subunit alcohol dehydrogenase family)
MAYLHQEKIMNVLKQFDLSGKVAIVTGGARGLGRQAALALAEAGADVAICRRSTDGTPASQEIEAMGPPFILC